MRGTWQGSGTWKTSGPDLGDLFGPIVLIGGATAVMTLVLEFIWYIVAFFAAALVGLAIGALTVRRRLCMHAAELEATRAERLAAATAKPQVTPGTAAPAIEYHVHHHYAVGQAPARAIPGKVLP